MMRCINSLNIVNLVFKRTFDFDVIFDIVVVVLPDLFRGMGTWRNSTETQQSGHAPRSGPEVKNKRSSTHF